MKERYIYLIRHAEPDWNTKEKCYLGQSDPPLSARGVKQAERLACLLREQRINTIYCSDLIRAVHTASIINQEHACQVIKCRELREINLGSWEGLSFETVKSRFPAAYAQRGKDIVNFRPPGGESFADLQHRVIPALENIINTTQGNIAMVAHAGVNRVIICHLMQIPLADLFSIKQDYAHFHLFQMGERITLLKSNHGQD